MMAQYGVHDSLTEDLREQLSLYVLRLLPESEQREIAEHLDGCPVCREEVPVIEECLAMLGDLAPPVDPPPQLRNRILCAVAEAEPQVWKQWDDSQPADLHVVRKGEGDWLPVCEGVSVRRLYVDRQRDSVTMLIRMEPGSSYDPHRHAGPEQCLVLEGDLFDGVREFRAGDFQVAAANTVHGVQSTRNGCLLFIVSSLHDELLPHEA